MVKSTTRRNMNAERIVRKASVNVAQAVVVASNTTVSVAKDAAAVSNAIVGCVMTAHAAVDVIIFSGASRPKPNR